MRKIKIKFWRVDFGLSLDYPPKFNLSFQSAKKEIEDIPKTTNPSYVDITPYTTPPSWIWENKSAVTTVTLSTAGYRP